MLQQQRTETELPKKESLVDLQSNLRELGLEFVPHIGVQE